MCYSKKKVKERVIMTEGENIKAARKRAGITQKELAEMSGLATITIQQYERNLREPRLENIKKIARALGIDMYRLSATPLDEFHKEVVEKATKEENELLDNYRQLNTDGQTEARKRVQELTEIKRYTEIEEPYAPD